MTPEYPPKNGFLNPPEKPMAHTPAGISIPPEMENDPQFHMNTWEAYFCDGESVSIKCVMADVVFMLNTSKVLLFGAPDGTQWNIASAKKFLLHGEEDNEE